MIPNSMPRSFMKLVLSAAVAATLAASPVQARDATRGDDSAAIIAALLGLVTLGVLLSGNDDEPTYPSGHVARPYKPTHPQVYPHRPHRPRGISKYRELPSSCLREYRTQTGRKIMFSNHCLSKEFKYARDLPRSCESTVVVKNRKGVYVTRRGYKPDCLSKRGYRATRAY